MGYLSPNYKAGIHCLELSVYTPCAGPMGSGGHSQPWSKELQLEVGLACMEITNTRGGYGGTLLPQPLKGIKSSMNIELLFSHFTCYPLPSLGWITCTLFPLGSPCLPEESFISCSLAQCSENIRENLPYPYKTEIRSLFSLCFQVLVTGSPARVNCFVCFTSLLAQSN